MKTAVNGLGLIGGSIAKELNRQASPFEVYGIDSFELHVSKAIELGLVRSTLSLDEAINRCTQMILAVPADKIQALPQKLTMNTTIFLARARRWKRGIMSTPSALDTFTSCAPGAGLAAFRASAQTTLSARTAYSTACSTR